jgi:hypothetical protein
MLFYCKYNSANGGKRKALVNITHYKPIFLGSKFVENYKGIVLNSPCKIDIGKEVTIGGQSNYTHCRPVNKYQSISSIKRG